MSLLSGPAYSFSLHAFSGSRRHRRLLTPLGVFTLLAVGSVITGATLAFVT